MLINENETPSHWTGEEFLKLINEFAEKVKQKKYAAMPYQQWRTMNKTINFYSYITFELNLSILSPLNITIYVENDTAHGFANAVLEFRDNDGSFGSFFMDYLKNRKEKKDKMINYDVNKSTSFTGSNCCYDPNLITNKYDYGQTITSNNSIGTITWDKCNTISTDFSGTIKADKIEVKDIVYSGAIKKEKKEEKEMKNFNIDFGPCDGNKVHMSMYGIAIKNSNGTWVSYDKDNKDIIDVDILNFNAGKFMFKMPVAVKEVVIGDVIIHNHVPMFVTKVNDASFTAVDVFAGEEKNIIPTKNMFGFNFVTKVVSFLDMSGMSADTPFGNMLPFMLMGEGKDIDPMMMMFMMNGKMDMSNPMMMYFMMKDGGKDNDMLPLLFMMNQNCGCGGKDAVPHGEKPPKKEK